MIFRRERVVFMPRIFFFFNNIIYRSGSGRAESGFYKNPDLIRTRIGFF